MFNITLEEKSYKLSFKALPVKKQRSKNRDNVPPTPLPSPFTGTDRAKNNDEAVEYQYVLICGQHDYKKQNCKIVLARYPGSHLFADGQVQNTIVMYIFCKEHRVKTAYPNRSRHSTLEVTT